MSCFDLPQKLYDEWTNTQEYVKRVQSGSRLEYVVVMIISLSVAQCA